MPLVTVLMSVHNGGKFLSEAIDSILHQTFDDFELLIINDGSTDETKNVLTGIDDKRVRIITHNKRAGLTTSLIEGVSLARGKYIARMDANDIADTSRLAMQIEEIRGEKKPGLVGSNHIIIDDDGRELTRSTTETDESYLRERLRLGNIYSHCSVMFDKVVYEKAGGYRLGFELSQDLDLWLRMAEIAPIAKVKNHLISWRLSPGSLSVTQRARQKKFADLALLTAYEREKKGLDTYKEFENDKKKLEDWIKRKTWVTDKDILSAKNELAYQLLLWRRPVEAAKIIKQTLRQFPNDLKSYWYLLMAGAIYLVRFFKL